jgi:hypothetical protein
MSHNTKIIDKILIALLSDIPQHKWTKEEGIDLEHNYISCVKSYFEIFNRFSNMSEEEIRAINKALERYDEVAVSRNSASGNTLPKLHELLGDRKDRDF